jgi:hypothetical protein
MLEKKTIIALLKQAVEHQDEAIKDSKDRNEYIDGKITAYVNVLGTEVPTELFRRIERLGCLNGTWC